MIPLAGIGGGGLAGLLGGGAGAGAGGFGAIASRFATPGVAGSVGGAPMAGGMPSGAGADSAGFWQKFMQQYGGGGGQAPAQAGGQAPPSNPFTAKLGQGAQLGTAYLDNLENRAGRLGEMLRGPTMPFMPNLNTSQVGPNTNPGQMGLGALLAQIATRRG